MDSVERLTYCVSTPRVIETAEEDSRSPGTPAQEMGSIYCCQTRTKAKGDKLGKRAVHSVS
jgi:hypothetical protein